MPQGADKTDFYQHDQNWSNRMILGDSLQVMASLAEREGYAFDLLSDHWPHGEVARAYGVFSEADGAAVRGTFIIDKSGVVRYTVVQSIDDARDPAEYEKVLATL